VYNKNKGFDNMKKDLVVYWSSGDCLELDTQDWSYLYKMPKVLFKDLKDNKNEDSDNASFFSCPAMSGKFKKILVFNSPLSMDYEYDFTSDRPIIIPKSEQSIEIKNVRKAALKFSPTIDFRLFYSFFSEEPLNAYFTPPMFHKPGYTKYAASLPGEFDIGQWFRPFNFEIQPWENKGLISIKENEPLFYVELKTERNIILKRFNMTKKIDSYMQANVDATILFGRGQNLASRYQRFKNIGMREKVINEIKKNLIEGSEIYL